MKGTETMKKTHQAMLDEEEDRRDPAEWDEDVKQLAQKIMKVIAGYAATDAIAAMAVVIKHVAEQAHD
jgi:hypothetical protein